MADWLFDVGIYKVCRIDNKRVQNNRTIVLYFFICLCYSILLYAYEMKKVYPYLAYISDCLLIIFWGYGIVFG